MRRCFNFPAARAAVRVAIAFALACAALGGVSSAQDNPLKVNDREYFEARGLNVLVFTNEYNGMFFDEKTAGVEIIHHGVRTATGGAVRLSPTPEQWDQIPKVVERKVDKAGNTIAVTLRYEGYGFTYRMVVTPAGAGFTIAVHLDTPLPARLEGAAGLNLEFLPSQYFERTYLADGKPGIFARHPAGPAKTRPNDTKITQFEGYTTFDDRGRNEYVEVDPVATGKRFVLAPEDPARRVAITALAGGDLMLLDGRNLAQNGWFVVRALLPAKATGKVAEWSVVPNTIPKWTRTPVIGFSQVGYHPGEKKVAVIELDPNDTPLATASVFELVPDGAPVERVKVAVKPWGRYLRYNYVQADFSSVGGPGLYFLEYGKQRTETFPIGPDVYSGLWHLTADVWFPVQMDHMTVNEGYRVWHGLPHMDDAVQAPLNFQHFDGYRMGAATESKYKPFERIPGLAVGGWFDAGDFDIQGGSHAGVITEFVDIWETFKPLRDQTFIDQATRFVDIHRPDGKPDMLQQIEHGALQIAAQYRALGRLNRGIVDGHLHQYHHLGDAATQTDNLIWDPKLKPYQVSADGKRSGTPDDRWVFTGRSPSLNYQGIASLAAASRALKGFNDALAAECLALAKKAYAEERATKPTAPPDGFEKMFGQGADLGAALQLMIATGEPQYVDRVNELIWPALSQPGGRGLLAAVRALPYLDAGAAAKLRPHVVKAREDMDALFTQNPYGVPIRLGGWAGSGTVTGWGTTAYHLHKAFPDLVGPEYVYRSLNFIFGTHPASNVSFVQAVGTKAKKLAYGNNRADFAIIPGGIVPGVMILKPDFPENMDDWPFLWGENECTIGGGSSYMFLAQAAEELAAKALPKQAPAAPPATAAAAPPQRPQVPQFSSPEVLPDRRVTFRLHAPEAENVALRAGDIPGYGMGPGSTPLPPMKKAGNGVWEATLGPLDPGAYRYSFAVAGVPVLDARNPASCENNTNVQSLLVVPGSDLFDAKEVPHGTVSAVHYYSKALKQMRRMHVYTPPGYQAGNVKYPVFYLLHGAGDSDPAWSCQGRANFILDNLIAARKAKPMIVVMPAGHTSAGGSMGRGPDGAPVRDPFLDDFATDIKPYIEANYRVLKGREHTAIAGLSMGGYHTLHIGMPHLDWFGYVGVYSSGLIGLVPMGRPGAPAAAAQANAPNPALVWEKENLAALDNPALKKGLKLLWFATGTDDFLMPTTKATIDLLKKHGFQPVFRETAGGHTWMNWRDYLVEFAPMLFQK